MRWHRPKQKRAAAGVAVLLLFGVGTRPAHAENIAQALQEITDTADRLCGTIAPAGQANSVKAAGEVKAELNGLAKRLANLGISGSGDISTNTYQGVLQQELTTALRDMRECKLKVFNTLQDKILPNIAPRPIPESARPEATVPAATAPAATAPAAKARCGGNSDDNIMAPVLNVFRAIEVKDIALYSSQWSDDATYKNAGNGDVLNKAQIVSRKQRAFEQWGLVQVQVDGPAVLHKNDSTAMLEDSYRLQIHIGGRIVNDGGRERYLVRCGANGRWQIVQNLDYIR